MCGIIGYVGQKSVQPILLDGLKRMEYRGYDSSGIALVESNGIDVYKKAGKLQNLLPILPNNNEGNIEKNSENIKTNQWRVGIGHIRWATHGEPNDVNAHPHQDCQGEIFVAHNGIIENYPTLKAKLVKKGHNFITQTDTEVLAHLIESFLNNGPLEKAVQKALKNVVGTYGIAVVSKREPEKIVAARLGSPLILGIMKSGEHIVASDVTAILPHTREVVYLDEGEIVTITPAGYTITTLDNRVVRHKVDQVEWDLGQAEKKGYAHFMLKEIMEQPEVVLNGIRGRLIVEDGVAHLGGFMEFEKKWQSINRVIIVACGSACFASVIGRYMLEEYAGVPTTVEVGSEFRYRQHEFDKKAAVVVVSQSGETADTIASLREAKRHGLMTFGIVNVVGSTLAREVDAGAYIHAGPEIAVASTKAFVGMLNIFVLFTLALGRQRNMTLVTGQRIAKELQAIPKKVEKVLLQNNRIKEIATKYQKYNHAFVLGRKYNVGIAREGALKLKEVAYVHAEGNYAGELKHGPLALVDNKLYSIFIAPKDSVYDKTVSNISELRARKGKAIAVTTEGNNDLEEIVDDVIYIPKTLEMLTPLLAVIPLQLLSYYLAVLRGCEIDQPRNLAKSVTVE